MIKQIPKLLFLIVLALLVLPFGVKAQEAVTISISPTLYDVPVVPGQSFNASIKIVNINKFDLTVYAKVMEFLPQGEGGDGRFIPVDASSTDNATLAEWMEITKDPIIIRQEQSVLLPISVKVPTNAPPGGHFAAIMIGTKPSRAVDGQARLQTAQTVTSLFFARVAGDINEEATIREFTTTKTFLGSPEATFSLRFENKGNVHLKPQGDIRIYNMWGEERGVIPINQYSNFGNVLSNSIRKFVFTWKGEWSPSDIGRYTAVATLGYGFEDKQFVSSKTIFWVVPIKLLLIITVSVLSFIIILSWLIRLYVRKMLSSAGIAIQDYKSIQGQTHFQMKPRVSRGESSSVGILDLSSRLEATQNLLSRLRVYLDFVVEYKLFFLGGLFIIVFIITATLFIRQANTDYRAYEVTYMQDESTPGQSVNSEEIIYNQIVELGAESATSSEQNSPKVKIVNRSGQPGLGAEARLTIEAAGFVVSELEADFTDKQVSTVIITNQENYESAFRLSKTLDGALISVSNEESGITVFVGSDMD